MNQAEITRLVTGLRIKIPPHKRRLVGSWQQDKIGERHTLESLKPTVASLIMHERLELPHHRAQWAREYTERLIQEAVLHGDKHKETMEVAKWWCSANKGAVYKLFKVLVPRFADYTRSYTRLMHGPSPIIQDYTGIKSRAIANQFPSRITVLELRGHPYPPLHYSNSHPNKNAIHNVLLSEAAKDYRLNNKKE